MDVFILIPVLAGLFLLMYVFLSVKNEKRRMGALFAWAVLLAAGTRLVSGWLLFAGYVYLAWLSGLCLPSLLVRKKELPAAIARPAADFLSLFTFFVPLNQAEDEDVSEEKIRELVDIASTETIDDSQKELLENVFELDDTDLEEICTHRTQVISLRMDQSADDWAKTILDNRHTLYPIVGKDNEDVVGILDTRDYFRMEDRSIPSLLAHAVDKPLFVAETMKADDLFALMQERKVYFAVVLDEYGGMTGIITLHDLMEALMGDMAEADEVSEPESITKLDAGLWEIYGLTPLDEAAAALELDLPVEEYDTFGGYVLGTYGFIPEDGSQLEVDLGPLLVRIHEVKDHRIGRMHVLKKQEGDHA